MTTSLYYKRLCEEDQDYSANFRLFLHGALPKDAADGAAPSPVLLLRGVEPALRAIRSCLQPPWGDATYRVRMQFCKACCQETENPFLEALDGHGGVEGNEGRGTANKGALLNMTIVTRFAGLDSVLAEVCEETNADGSYLTEVQLRERVRRHMADQCQSETSRGCNAKGMCGVLQGDTVFWNEWREMTRFEPATREELIEREWLQKDGTSGYYERWAAGLRKKKAEEDAKSAGSAAKKQKA